MLAKLQSFFRFNAKTTLIQAIATPTATLKIEKMDNFGSDKTNSYRLVMVTRIRTGQQLTLFCERVTKYCSYA